MNHRQWLQCCSHQQFRWKCQLSRKIFSKYADHVVAKYAAKICGNRPRLHMRVNLTWYILGGGIAQSLFSKFTAYQSLESTRIGLIRSNNFFKLQQQIVCIIVCHVHLTTNIDYPEIQKLDKSGNWKNNYKEYLITLKMPKYAKKICDMRTLLKYAKNAAKCQIYGNHIFAFFWHA